MYNLTMQLHSTILSFCYLKTVYTGKSYLSPVAVVTSRVA